MGYYAALQFKTDGKALVRQWLMLLHKRHVQCVTCEEILEHIAEEVDLSAKDLNGSAQLAEDLIKRWVCQACTDFRVSFIAGDRGVPALAIPVNQHYFDTKEWPETVEEAKAYLCVAFRPTYGVHFIYEKSDFIMLAYLNMKIRWANGCMQYVQNIGEAAVKGKLIPNTGAVKMLVGQQKLEQLD